MTQSQIPSSLDELVSIMGSNNPRFQILAEFMKRSKAADIQEDEKKEARRKQFEEVRQLRKEYAILVSRNNSLASALGACPYCWGTEPKCQCRGDGKPGSRFPSKDKFNELVMPALIQLGIIPSNDSGSD